MTKRASSNFTNKDINPCLEESELSMQCIEDELYNYSKCKLFFENYKNCKKFWSNIRRQRNMAGITPSLPTKEERDKILELKQKGQKVISAKIT